MTLKWPYYELNSKLGNRSKLIYDVCRMNSEKFQNLSFNLNVLFLKENHKNHNWSEFADFYELAL